MITWQIFEMVDDGVGFAHVEQIPAHPEQYGPIEAVAACYGQNTDRYERCGPKGARFMAIRPAAEGCADDRPVAFYVRIRTARGPGRYR